MKRTLLCLIVCVFSLIGLYAQSIKTSFSEKIVLTDYIGIPQHTFYAGESVTIHAYKKKSDRYHFLIETEDYAASINSNKIPFYTTEQELKKLPSATGKSADALLRERLQAVNQRKAVKEQQQRLAKERADAEAKAQYRTRALNGQIKVVLKHKAAYLETKNGEKPFESGDTVSLVGFSYHNYIYSYAMYSDKAAGIFQTGSSGSDIVEYKNGIDFTMFPSCDDPEVKRILEKQSVIVDSIKSIRAIKEAEEAAEKAAEDRRIMVETLTNRIREYKENNPFIVSDIYWYSNSVGGITVRLSITNCSQNTIKYVTFQGYFLNAVGDRCRNEIGGSTIWKARGVGPIGPCPTTIDNHYERYRRCEASYEFDNLTFYSRVADSFRLSSVTIEYINGRKMTLSGANLNKHVRY